MTSQVLDLKAFRKAKKLRQQDIADTIGVHRVRLSKYEIGKERPNSILESILKAYPEAKEFLVEAKDIPQKKDYEALLKANEDEINYLREMNRKLLSLVEKNKATLQAISNIEKKKTKK